MNFPDELQVRIPRPLAQKEIRAAVGIGLFKIAIGREPGEIPEGEKVNQRIKLCAKAKKYLKENLKYYDNQQEIIINALTWVYHQPEHVRQSQI
jgi:hypothetical protein